MEIEDNEKFTDPLDEAAAKAAAAVDSALLENTVKLRPQQVRNADGSWPHVECVECGDDLPEKRIEAGRIYCTPCQGLMEVKQKRGLK